METGASLRLCSAVEHMNRETYEQLYEIILLVHADSEGLDRCSWMSTYESMGIVDYIGWDKIWSHLDSRMYGQKIISRICDW